MSQTRTPPHAELGPLSEGSGGRIDYLCRGSACCPFLPAPPSYRKHLRMERQRGQGLLEGPQQPTWAADWAASAPARPWKRAFRCLLWTGASHRTTSFKPQHDPVRQAPPIKWKHFISKGIRAQKSSKLPRITQLAKCLQFGFAF